MTNKIAPGVSLQDSFFVENVIRKREVFPIDDMQVKMQAFFDKVHAVGLQEDGPFFYSLNNTPMDKMVDIEFFLPIIENADAQNHFVYNSYFEMNNVIKTQLFQNYEEKTEEAYARLMWTLESNQQDLRTPFYHLFSAENSESVTIFVGYAY